MTRYAPTERRGTRKTNGTIKDTKISPAKIPIASYQRFESGDRNIMTASFQMACRVIEALELDIAAFFHGDYILGEAVFDSPEGLRYKKTGKRIDEDVVESNE